MVAWIWVWTWSGRRGEGVEQVVPLRGREEEHVVGRRLRLGLRRCADVLEERIGLREVDDPVDGDRDRVEPGSSEVTVSPGATWRLAAVCWATSTPLPARPGRGSRQGRRPVVVGQAEDDARSGGLRRATGGGLEPRGGGRSRPSGGLDERVGGDRRLEPGQVGAGLGLDLPIDGDVADGAPGHGCLGGGEEAPIEARRATAMATPAAAASRRPPRRPGEAAEPGEGDHSLIGALRLASSTRVGIRSTMAGSWVVTTRPAPRWSPPWSRASTTTAPASWSSCPVGSSARMSCGRRRGSGRRRRVASDRRRALRGACRR